MAALTERVQNLQSELSQSELRREELEAELSSTQEVREISWVSVTNGTNPCSYSPHVKKTQLHNCPVSIK